MQRVVKFITLGCKVNQYETNAMAQKFLEKGYKVIEENAIKLANEKVDQARSEIEQQVEEKEQNIDELIEQMAKEIIKENEQYIGRDVKEKAIEKIDGTEEGGIIDGKTKTRGRKKRTTV